MTIKTRAIYEGGVFKPLGRLHLQEHQPCQITVVTEKPAKKEVKGKPKKSAHPILAIANIFQSKVSDLSQSHDDHLYSKSQS